MVTIHFWNMLQTYGHKRVGQLREYKRLMDALDLRWGGKICSIFPIIFPGFPQFFHHELPICPMEKQRSARTAEARGELFASEALQWSMALEALQRSCWTLRKAFKGPGKAFECLGVRESKKGWWYYPSERFIAC